MVVPPTYPTVDKPEMRRAMRAVRRKCVEALTADDRESLHAALAGRLGLLIASDAIVAAYAPLRDEIAPPPGHALPWFASRDAPMRFRTGAACADGPWGRQPDADAPLVEPDVVLVPLVAADLAGNRLGQGAGHYDRAIAALRARRPLRVVGLAWDVQIVDALTPEPHDARLDAIATPSRLIEPRR